MFKTVNKLRNIVFIYEYKLKKYKKIENFMDDKYGFEKFIKCKSFSFNWSKNRKNIQSLFPKCVQKVKKWIFKKLVNWCWCIILTVEQYSDYVKLSILYLLLKSIINHCCESIFLPSGYFQIYPPVYTYNQLHVIE